MIQPLTPAERAAQLESDLAGFIGTESYTSLRYPWLRQRFLLTDGAKYLADQAKAYWLMDAIASHQQASKAVADEEFQFWTLSVGEKRAAVLICTDGNNKELVRQKISYTDFPLNTITLYVALDECLGGLVVMLTSEY
jgi:hypothetical protein